MTEENKKEATETPANSESSADKLNKAQADHAESAAESKQDKAAETEEKAAETKAQAEKSEGKAAETETKAAKPEKKAESAAEEAATTKSDGTKAAKPSPTGKAPAARAAKPKPAAASKKDEPDEPKPPSPNQPKLDRIVDIIRKQVSDEAVEEAYINEADRHLPCIVIRSSHWVEVSQLLRDHEELKLDYLRNVSGVDHETHMEVVYHLLSLSTRDEYCVKVKTDRDQPSIPSVTPVWNTANWNEREIYDLFGIDFPGHPDLRRIMMPDDWVGHPLRKDYEPYDPEV